jgi:hypothetical protein
MNRKELKSERYVIPCDIVCEIAQIILQANLKHEIVGVKDERRVIILLVEYDEHSKFQVQAVENIEEMLHSYHSICFNGDNRISWREY